MTLLLYKLSKLNCCPGIYFNVFPDVVVDILYNSLKLVLYM